MGVCACVCACVRARARACARVIISEGCARDKHIYRVRLPDIEPSFKPESSILHKWRQCLSDASVSICRKHSIVTVCLLQKLRIVEEQIISRINVPVGAYRNS